VWGLGKRGKERGPGGGGGGGGEGYCVIENCTRLLILDFICKDRGKSVPLQAWSGPEGSRKLTFPDFVTSAQDGGKVVSLMHRPPLWQSRYRPGVAQRVPGS